MKKKKFLSFIIQVLIIILLVISGLKIIDCVANAEPDTDAPVTDTVEVVEKEVTIYTIDSEQYQIINVFYYDGMTWEEFVDHDGNNFWKIDSDGNVVYQPGPTLYLTLDGVNVLKGDIVNFNENYFFSY